MRYLGIDFGLKKIGLALGDDETRIASPLEVIPREGSEDYIERLIKEDGIERFVVGLPVSAGSFHGSDQQKLTEAFIEGLRSRGMHVETCDERYTSTESQRLQQEYGLDMPEDALAAMLILQSFFNELPRP
ncbi:MAG: Holliday junction resolvase RuvX [Patescibacteria group bacterium]|jgi:putative Holliday junction resolvase